MDNARSPIQTTTQTRRQVLRLLGGATLALIPANRLAGDALAGRVWCRYDPTVMVDGEIVNLYVSGVIDVTYTVSGPTALVIRVPGNVEYAVLEQDAGFGHGYDISFMADRKLKSTNTELEIAAEVYVPTNTAGKGQPILVEWVPDGTVKVAAKKEGTTNAWIRVDTKIKRGN